MSTFNVVHEIENGAQFEFDVIAPTLFDAACQVAGRYNVIEIANTSVFACVCECGEVLARGMTYGDAIRFNADGKYTIEILN